MAFVGDTVRLRVQFKTFTGQLVSPNDIKLTIYDKQNNQIEEIEITDSDKENIGVYFYDYIIPDDILDYFIFEFGGLHNNKPILSRGKVNVKFN